jgi:hypothetical protein
MKLLVGFLVQLTYYLTGVAMKNGFTIGIVLAAVLMSLAPAAMAQYNVPHGTFSCGGGVRSGSHFVYDTAGQGPIGYSTGGSYIVKSGFWYIAELSSTVDVAITNFEAEYLDDVVVIRWCISATEPFEGINIYRADGESGEFLRINKEIVAPEQIGSYSDETAVPGRTYTYRIGAAAADGEVFSVTISLTLPPKPLTLYQNVPNPFNPSTSIAFFLPSSNHVRLVIYDIQGKKIRTLCDETRDMGRHTIHWNGTNDLGNAVGSGVYYYRLDTGKKTLNRKMVILR